MPEATQEQPPQSHSSEVRRNIPNKEDNLERVKRENKPIIERLKQAAEAVVNRLRNTKREQAKIVQIKTKIDQVNHNPQVLNARGAEKVFKITDSVPQDEDLVLILNSIVDVVGANKEALMDKLTLSNWITQLTVIQENKPTESIKEIDKYISRLHEQYGYVLYEQLKAEPNLGEVDMRNKMNIATKWIPYVGKDIPPEAVERLMHQGISPYEQWKLMEETHQYFRNLPEEAQKMIRDVNDTAEVAPNVITPDFLMNLVERIDNTPEISQVAKRALKVNVGEKIREMKDYEFQVGKYQDAAKTPEEAAKTAHRLAAQEEELRRVVGEISAKTGQLREMRAHSQDQALQEGRNVEVHKAASAVEMLSNNLQIKEFESRLASLEQIENLTSNDARLINQIRQVLELKKHQVEINDEAVRGRTTVESGYQSRRFYKELGDLNFITNELSKPELVVERCMNNPEEFNKFKKSLFHAVVYIFRNADDNTDQPFEQSYNQIVHQPVFEEIQSMVREIKDVAYAKYIESDDPSARAMYKAFSEEMNTVSTRITVERKLRNYTHNVAFILQTRGTLENLAGFSEQFGSGDLSYAFEDNELVLMASHFIEQKVNQTLTDNNWMIPPEFLQVDSQLGRVRLDYEVIEMLNKYYEKEIRSGAMEDWEVQRAYRLAKGITLGATAVILDRLADAQPPTAKGYGAFAGYFGEGVLATWNPMKHNLWRWENPSEMHQIMYALVREHGTSQGWSHKDMAEVMDKLQNAKGSKKMEILLQLGGKPLVEYNNFFTVGGPLTRGGWRMDAASYSLLVSKDATGPILDEEEIIVRSAEKNPKYLAKSGLVKNLEGVEWNASWENMKRAGSAVMWHWVNPRAETEAKIYTNDEAKKQGKQNDEKWKSELKEKKVKELQKKYRKEVFEHIKKVNPLKYAYFEKEDLSNHETFEISMRGKAIQSVLGSQIKRLEDAIDDKGVNRATAIEENLLMVQEKAMIRARKDYDILKARYKRGEITYEQLRSESTWGIRTEDYDVITDDAEREKVIAYKTALDNAIGNAKFASGIAKNINRNGDPFERKGAVDTFAEKTYDFFIGSEDLDFTQLDFKKAGQSLIGRAFKDANHLNHGVQILLGYDKVLSDAAASHKYEDIIKAIDEMVHPIHDLHGHHKSSKAAYRVAVMTARYFQKDWKWRLPGSSVVEWLSQAKDTALSKHEQGKRSWQWDEDTTRMFIEDLYVKKILITDDYELLKKEIGGRTSQVWIDRMRTVVPLLMLLMFIQAVREAVKDE